MEDDGNKEIKEYINKLPLVVRNAVLGNEWHKRVGDIAAKYSLHLDQISALEYETLFVLIGMEAEADFTSNIEHHVGVSKILAAELASEISERIFKYILKLMEEKSAPASKRFESAPSNVSTISPQANTSGGLLSELEKMASQITPQEPKMGEPPMNLPGIEETKVTPSPVATDTPVSKVAPPVPNYSTDPYREPIE